MKGELNQPKTLMEAVAFFSDNQRSFDTMLARRWPNGVACPSCGCANVRFMNKRRFWNCNGCRKQFSIKTGTIFEASAISLGKWLTAAWLISNAKNGISSCELARSVGVTQKSAWFMLHRIRLAMQMGSFNKLSGHVEADETYIGGKARNMHWDKKEHVGVGSQGKATVIGLLERGGKVVVQIVEKPNRRTLHKYVFENVDQMSNLYTDSHRAYENLQFYYSHQVVNHAVQYVRGNVHTNGMENFWSLLKRTIRGTYVSVEPFHLFRYLDEQSFRFNFRKSTDADRFTAVASNVAGKRLTYANLTGKELATGA